MDKITIRQTASPIRRKNDQRATLVGLGLNALGAPPCSTTPRRRAA